MNIDFSNIEVGLQVLNDLTQNLYRDLEKLEGLSVIIPYGRYQGRYGKISAISIDTEKSYFHRISVLIHPYNLKKKDGSILYDDVDARRYWDWNKIKDTITDKPIEKIL